MKSSFIRTVSRRIVDSLGYALVPKSSLQGYPPDFSPEIIETLEAVRPFTMTSQERVFSLVKAVEYVVSQNIPGEIVECGVWKGGSMMAVAKTLIRLKQTGKRLYLFDTFEGMPPAEDVDRNFRGENASRLMDAQDQASWIWAIAQIDEVKKNMASTGYPPDKITYIKGKVEETIPGQAPEKIAILRLDTDWYESTKHELEYLYPRLSPGGVLIIDDYGHWAGAKKAVDEYIAKHNIPLLLCRIDYTGRIAVKQ
ncbi:MAG: macrocin O-methyltransferase [Chlorobiales bacterium]|nr:macrocin O-methyltransferase [Chlorobiales bacterium]